MIHQRVVEGPGIARSASPLSQAVVAEGKFVFTAGQVGRDPSSGEVPSDFLAQTRLALQNLKSVLAAAGAQPQDVVRMLVFVTDLGRGQEFNQVYGEFFGHDFPTRTRVQVAALASGYQIEIEAIATLPEGCR